MKNNTTGFEPLLDQWIIKKDKVSLCQDTIAVTGILPTDLNVSRALTGSQFFKVLIVC